MSLKYILIVIVLSVLIGGGILAYQYYWMPKEPESKALEPKVGEIELPQGSIEEEKFISEEEATNLVKNLPKVKEWLALFTGPGGISLTTGGKPIIQVDSKSDEGYTIHVYELLSDHTATFNWYSVNSKTGEIVPMFDF